MNNEMASSASASTNFGNISVGAQDGAGTQYQISCTPNDQHISFNAVKDAVKKQKNHHQSASNKNEGSLKDFMTKHAENKDVSCKESSQDATIPSIPESVLQYQRQMRKIQAADRALKTNVNIEDHLHTVYSDDDIVVTNNALWHSMCPRGKQE